LPTLFFVFGSLCSEESLTPRIGIATRASFYGERELSWKIKLAAEQLGWEAFVDEAEGIGLQQIPHLDWVICLVPRNPYRTPGCPNYLALFHDVGFFDEKGQLFSFYENYEPYLLTIPQDRFARAFPVNEKLLFSMPFYPSVQNIPYQPLPLHNIATMMPVWGNRLKEPKYIALYQMLSESGWVKFYGPPDPSQVIREGYMGPLEFDGISVIRALQNHGIALVLHSRRHNRAKIPSGRIFEAAAASAVIISDQNAFVQKHFGDSVYSIDVSGSAEEIYAQIMACKEAIQRDPESALRKAAQAHRIFEEKFSMTTQLLRLENLHREMKKLSAN
jgi:hypothetical protein